MTIPFTTFEDYFPALAYSLCTEFFADPFPAYDTFCKENKLADAKIVHHILNLHETKENAQLGLSGLVKTLVENHRYAKDLIPTFEGSIKRMLMMGAVFREDDLRMIVEPIEDCELEDQWVAIEVKACLLAFLHRRFGMTIPSWILNAPIDATMDAYEDFDMAYFSMYRMCLVPWLGY